MGLNPKNEKERLENHIREEKSGFKMDRVMSAPPQEFDEKSLALSENLAQFNNSETFCNNKCNKSNETEKLEAMLKDLNINGKDILEEEHYFEEESEEIAHPSDFIKFIQIEQILKQFPPLNIDSIKSRINQILESKERAPVDITFMFSKSGGEESVAEKIKNLKSKVNTNLERVRTEFNRVTSENVKEVAQIILSIRIEKISEMQEIAAFVFEKIISETVYFDVYLSLFKDLYKKWTCEEEEKTKKTKQTCFYGTTLSLAYRKHQGLHDWYAQIDPSKVSVGSTENIDDKIEELYTDKLKKKEQALGAINFLVSLYILNVTGFTTANMIVDNLTSKSNPENVVMLCYVYGSLGRKLLENAHSDTFERMYEYLHSHLKSGDSRLEVEVEKALNAHTNFLPLLSKIKCGSISNNNASKKTNSFALLEVEETEQPSSPVEKPKSDREILEAYILDLSGTLSDVNNQDDILDIGENVSKKIDKFNNREFLKAYLVEMVINPKNYQKFLSILLKKLLIKAISLPEALCDLKEDMPFLSSDYPCSKKHFSELLCTLKAIDLISNDEFNKLRPTELVKQAGGLLRQWKEASDNRLLKVLSEEEIRNL